MKIAIDIQYTLKRKTGMGYFTENLVHALAAIDKQDEFFLISRFHWYELKKWKGRMELTGRNFRYRQGSPSVPLRKLLKGMDLYHTSSPDHMDTLSCKGILTVHDCLWKSYPSTFQPKVVKRIEDCFVRGIARAEGIMTSSHATKNDIVQWYRLPKEKIRVVYIGVGEEFEKVDDITERSYISKRYGLGGPYLLYVGGIEPRKNVSGLMRAFFQIHESIPHRLVLVGCLGWRSEEVQKLRESLHLEKKVLLTDYVPKKDLVLLYSFADLFIYPSFYEGFGIPILEAFKCQVPVVTSLGSALEEVAGDAAILVHPDRPEEIAQAIVKGLRDTTLRQEMIQKGVERAKQFSWGGTARQVLSFFEEVYS